MFAIVAGAGARLSKQSEKSRGGFTNSGTTNSTVHKPTKSVNLVTVVNGFVANMQQFKGKRPRLVRITVDHGTISYQPFPDILMRTMVRLAASCTSYKS